MCAGYCEPEAPVFLEVAVDVVGGDEIKVSFKPILSPSVYRADPDVSHISRPDEGKEFSFLTAVLPDYSTKLSSAVLRVPVSRMCVREYLALIGTFLLYRISHASCNVWVLPLFL